MKRLDHDVSIDYLSHVRKLLSPVVLYTFWKVPESPAMKTVGRLGGKVYAAVGPQV